MTKLLLVLLSWLTFGAVDLIDTEYYTVTDEYTLNVTNFYDYAIAEGVPTITLENMVVNGGFNTNVNYWTSSHSNNSWVNGGYLSNVGTGTLYLPYFRTNYNFTTNIDDDIYTNIRFKITNSNSLYVREYIVTGTIFTPNLIEAPVNDIWYNAGFLTTVITGSSSSFIQFAHSYTSSAIALNSQMLVDYVIYLNLGTSNTYTKLQLDNLISFYGYFEGEKTFLDIESQEFLDLYLTFYGSVFNSSVYVDFTDNVYYIENYTSHDIDINDIGIMIIYALAYISLAWVVRRLTE